MLDIIWTTGKNSINRNIVECKDISLRGRSTEQGVLIETLWNVKYSGGNWISGGNSY